MATVTFTQADLQKMKFQPKAMRGKGGVRSWMIASDYYPTLSDAERIEYINSQLDETEIKEVKELLQTS